MKARHPDVVGIGLLAIVVTRMVVASVVMVRMVMANMIVMRVSGVCGIVPERRAASRFCLP